MERQQRGSQQSGGSPAGMQCHERSRRRAAPACVASQPGSLGCAPITSAAEQQHASQPMRCDILAATLPSFRPPTPDRYYWISPSSPCTAPAHCPCPLPALSPQGDYHRYLAEFKTGAERKEAAEHTLLAYKAAQVGAGRGGMPG